MSIIDDPSICVIHKLYVRCTVLAFLNSKFPSYFLLPENNIINCMCQNENAQKKTASIMIDDWLKLEEQIIQRQQWRQAKGSDKEKACGGGPR